jgi:hypothetical protein
MNPHVTSLIECLMETQLSISEKKIERCGFLLSMLIEKHSKQRTPGSFYEENLPEPYVEDCTKCLARMLSSPEQVREQALEIRQVLPDLADLVELIGNAVGQEGQASCVLAKLQRLLAD